MVKAAVFLAGVAAADELAITWSDCGAKHAKTNKITPSSLPLGSETEIIGSGTVDEDVTGGTYDSSQGPRKLRILLGVFCNRRH